MEIIEVLNEQAVGFLFFFILLPSLKGFILKHQKPCVVYVKARKSYNTPYKKG